MLHLRGCAFKALLRPRCFAATAALPETMKAVVWRGSSDPRDMRMETLRVPKPSAHEVLVKVRACGICRSDLKVIKGEFPYGTSAAVLGHEISGTVADVGPGVTGVGIGTKVACTFVTPCGTCHLCRLGEEGLCPDVKADAPPLLMAEGGEKVGVSVFGGLAEYAVLRKSGVYALPPECEPVWSEAAILGCAYITAMGAARNSANLQAKDSVCVIGAGGVGSSLIQVAKYIGAMPIIAVDITDAALEHASAMGADYTINSNKEDALHRILKITNGLYVDTCFEVIGLKETFDLAVSSIRPGGKACLVGTSGSAAISIPMLNLVRNGKKIIGSYAGNPSTIMPELLAGLAAGSLDVKSTITQRFALEEAGEGYGLLADNKLPGRGIVILE